MGGLGDLCDAVTAAADQVSDILEAPRGLKHPRHQFHLAPIKGRIRGVMAGYFKRQAKAVQESIDEHVVSVVSQFREAENGKQFAATLVPSSFRPLRFPVLDSEVAIYEAAITAAIVGAAEVLNEEMQTGAVTPPNVATEYLRENSLSKLTGDIAETTKDRLRDALADAWDRGGSYDQLKAAVKETFADFSDKRAGLIAQTEAVDAYNEGRRATAVRVGLDEKSWETESGNPCPTCTANEDEGWIPIDQDHASGDSEPTAHPNCFLGSTSVLAFNITHAIRRWYKGPICILRFAGCADLSVTPNHPILTRRGWVAAGLLNLGDYAFQCDRPSGYAGRPNPDDDYMEASIEEIFNALVIAGCMRSTGVPLAPEAFHGDVQANAKVDIVWTARAVGGGLEFFHLRPKFDFRGGQRGRVALHSNSPSAEIGEASLAATDGIMSVLGTRGTELLRQRGIGNQLSVSGSALLQAETSPVIDDGEARDTNTERNSLDCFTSKMIPVKLLEINSGYFSGHVFNLSTESDLYLANTIIAHNCECVENYRSGSGTDEG